MIIRTESPGFYILLALIDRPRHGLAIQREVLDLTEGELHLWPATLYTNLSRLAERGWIEELGPKSHPRGVSQKRRYYQLTIEGRKVLEHRVESLGRVVAHASSKLARHPLGNS